jgi:hypothetical protein
MCVSREPTEGRQPQVAVRENACTSESRGALLPARSVTRPKAVVGGLRQSRYARLRPRGYGGELPGASLGRPANTKPRPCLPRPPAAIHKPRFAMPAAEEPIFGRQRQAACMKPTRPPRPPPMASLKRRLMHCRSRGRQAGAARPSESAPRHGCGRRTRKRLYIFNDSCLDGHSSLLLGDFP